MLEPASRGDYSNLEEPTIFYLGEESLRSTNPSIINLSTPMLVKVVSPKVTPIEHQLVLQAAMEENSSTSSGSPHTPILTTTTWGMFPRNPPSSVQTTTVSTPSTSGSGMIPSSVATTASFTQSVTGPQFHMGCSSSI
jgi:hypothetical protein